MAAYSPKDQDDLSDYDFYSKTPPRTKILRKNRERKQKKEGASMSSPKIVKSNKQPLNRRNTASSMFEDLVAKADTDSEQGGPKRTSKRQMKLLRDSERDLKLDIASAQAVSDAKVETGPPQTPQPSYQIESCKRFKSLSCRTVPCSKAKSLKDSDVACKEVASEECGENRVEFYNTLSMLIRMGCGDKAPERGPGWRGLSREDQLWQNEIKDLIWLELQAYHADRTTTEEDNYIMTQREKVDTLLQDIMTYRFNRHPKCYSTQNSDSGIEDDCNGCLNICCVSCVEAQNEALKDIEDLMCRLGEAEALFPSGRAFAELFPLYSSSEFTSRVKAISLWYNMTVHQRLKLMIMIKLLENKLGSQKDDDRNGGESNSPTDSNNSSASSVSESGYDSKGSTESATFNFSAFPMVTICQAERKSTIAYRKYIENILKTRSLHKSLGFLDNLQMHVLKRVQLTLTPPKDSEIFLKTSCDTEDEELQRYGSWSPEAKSLNLPSYRAIFLFLAAIPLKIIHEFLKMRLEEKPEKPSPLSVRQLMRELKEGLKIATTQKKNAEEYKNTVFYNSKMSMDDLDKKFQCFDECMLKVFSDYLDYLEQWALLHHENFQKNLLEEEWKFSCEMVEHITGGSELLGKKFGAILCTLMKSVSERLRDRIEEVLCLPKEDKNLIKQRIFVICREMQAIFNEEREMFVKTMAFSKTVLKHDIPVDTRLELVNAFISLKCTIPETIGRVQSEFDQINMDLFEDLERSSVLSRIREILMQGYRFGFEFYKEMSESIPNTKREKLAPSLVHFAHLWMKFVTERCERGRGMRPRWAYQGLEFLLIVCEPRNTQYLSEEQFEDLKRKMDVCISHVIGTTAPSTPESGFYSASPRVSLDHVRTRSRGSSPSPRPTYKSQRSNSRKTSQEHGSPVTDSLNEISFNANKFQRDFSHFSKDKSRLEAVENLDSHLDAKRRKQHLIGKVVNCNGNVEKIHIRRRLREVTFTWQRGIKIGQGRFGKVYTAVNNKTGEMMAVKELTIQPHDALAVKRVGEEMKILEGIVHRNLVRYYGVEVHKDEMLIFMEFCAEGTLESLVAASEGGLSELLVRRYTFQLVSGVACLHEHGIVHRDIKTANIFLTENGNCLKIGDFGCAAKIKSNSTMPGELQGFVGTQAYMAPEVFTKNMNEGHGRAADIWSVGCVAVEMASGKRPWAQFDSNYQIMFKVGMGQSPDPPDDMIDEGLDFLELCFQHNPKERATAQELLAHPFVKVGDDFV